MIIVLLQATPTHSLTHLTAFFEKYCSGPNPQSDFGRTDVVRYIERIHVHDDGVAEQRQVDHVRQLDTNNGESQITNPNSMWL